jgi:hypothetical protein
VADLGPRGRGGGGGESIERDLDDLELAIRKLQIEWDKFFGGVERVPPHDLKRRTERMIRDYVGAEIRNSATRFRYQSLSARYSTYNELWQKRLRAIEEGRPWHGPKVVAPPPPAPPQQRATQGAGGSAFRVSNQLGDAETVKKLFDQFVDARRRSGETASVKFESFQKLIAQQTGRILTSKGAKAVDFRLETKDGKVSLKAKPVKS